MTAPPLGARPPHISNPVPNYLDELASRHSQRAARQGLDRALSLLGGELRDPDRVAWWEITRLHMQVLRRRLMMEEYAVSTANVTLCAVRGVAKACCRMGLMDAAEYKDLASVKGFKPGTGVNAGRLVEPDERAALFAACREDAEAGDPAGPRDAAIMGMLCAGMRRDEVATLQYEHLADLNDGRLRVVPEGGPERDVWLADGAQDALFEWLELRGYDDGPMWSRIRKGGHLVLPPTGMSAQGVFDVCKRRATQAGLRKPLTPHDLRRTFVHELLQGGIDSTLVYRLVGQKTPGKAIEVTAAKAKQAVALLPVDY